MNSLFTSNFERMKYIHLLFHNLYPNEKCAAATLLPISEFVLDEKF